VADSPVYCDVSLPVPLDRAFTYLLPETLHHRAQPGCRIIVPFGPRKLTGVILQCHSARPEAQTKEALRLLDEEPVLDEQLMSLAHWIAAYYCAPLGEVLRGMTPLAGETRHSKIYTLTTAGRDAARQLALTSGDETAGVQLLQLLETRPLPVEYLVKKVAKAKPVLRSLAKRGLVALEEEIESKDPLRAPAERLRIEFLRRPDEEKLSKAERELIAYLELHPGGHNLAILEEQLGRPASAARTLARRGLIKAEAEAGLDTLSSFYVSGRPELNADQHRSIERVSETLRARKFETFLLHGVTGSGKTEVYLRLIEECLPLGRSALLLVPEIGLTPQVAAQFHYRFPKRVAILHSAFSGMERAEQWRRIRSGEAAVVVATRSGVFAPVRDLGLVIVDEEHDQSYKQQETPRYHGRDVAIVRARAAGAAVVLGSATPSLESRYNAEKGKYHFLTLPERIEQRPLPEVQILDMRVEFQETRKQSTFSRALVAAVQDRMDRGEQVMILLNRRGFSSFAACRSCGERLQCRHCAVTLTYHRRDRRMLCHYCGYAEQVPDVCPKCSSEHVYFLGIGSERVEDELHRDFPKARIARMDRDTVSGRRDYETILHGFRNREFDLLVGTQMIAKGHDIPNVTLVGIVNADVGLGLPDFRAAERTFQLLTQAAGRAGRGGLPGTVLLQTINPEHYAIRFAAEQDYGKFYTKEIEFRRLMRYPPFSALANLLVRHPSQEEALRMSGELGQFLTPPPDGVRILGPAEAPVPRLKQDFRYQLLLKAASRKRLGEVIREIRIHTNTNHWPVASLVIDVDPISLL